MVFLCLYGSTGQNLTPVNRTKTVFSQQRVIDAHGSGGGVDDILDAGQTMAEIRTRVMACGAERFFCAVFVDKNTGKKKPLTADFVGLTVPDRFVFGYGMDIHGAWRNLPEIYARKE